MTERTDRELPEKRPEDHFTHCGDCGQFVPKDRWIRKDNPRGCTHALCLSCLSNYDDPAFM